jgi:hypothetical protein
MRRRQVGSEPRCGRSFNVVDSKRPLIDWAGGRALGNHRINRIDRGQALRSAVSFRTGCAALLIGLTTILLGIATHNTTTGTAVMIGLGGLIAVIAVWSLLAVDPTYDFLTLAIAGLALFISPWVGNFVGDHAAVTAWVAGAFATALGVGGYVHGESQPFATTAREASE